MPRLRGPRAGFTLIEMLAVVALFVLIASFAMPNFSLLRTRRLRNEAERLAAQLELGRQRSVVTSVSHRLLIDLDGSAYRLEWLVSEAESMGEPELEPPGHLEGGRAPIAMSPPPEAVREYRPVPGQFGRRTRLEGELHFAGVETDQGWSERGEISVGFERDGSADYAEITLQDESGEALTVDVLPLAEVVRIRDAVL